MAVLLTYINVNGAAERHKHLKVFECLRTMHSMGGSVLMVPRLK